MPSTLYRLAPLAPLVLLLASALAQATTYEDIQRIKAREGLPRWQQAAQRTQAQRAQPPTEAVAAAWDALDAQTDPLTGKAPPSVATGSTTANAPEHADLLVHASWLRWRVLSQNADARYAFAYAMDLDRMGNPRDNYDQEAIIFLFRAKLALTLDGMRCSDRSKAEHLQTWYSGLDRLKPLAKKAARLSLADKSAAILEAITMEEMLGERPPMPWLCPRRDTNTNTPQTEADTAPPPPRYLADGAWRKYRKDLLEQLTRNALKDL